MGRATTLVAGVALALALACAGGEPTEDAPADAAEPEPQREIVVVPVDGDAGPFSCCEISTEDGQERHTLARGPGECRNKLGGAWVEGPECIPCCCKRAHDAEHPDQGSTYELTTPGSCAGVGECVTDDVPACPNNHPGDGGDDGDDDDDDDAAEPAPKPDPRPRPRPTEPRPKPRPGGPSGARPR